MAIFLELFSLPIFLPCFPCTSFLAVFLAPFSFIRSGPPKPRRGTHSPLPGRAGIRYAGHTTVTSGSPRSAFPSFPAPSTHSSPAYGRGNSWLARVLPARARTRNWGPRVHSYKGAAATPPMRPRLRRRREYCCRTVLMNSIREEAQPRTFSPHTMIKESD